jgi:class 3 adenylate cyclase
MARPNASRRCAASSSIRKIAEHHGRIVKTTGDGMLV